MRKNTKSKAVIDGQRRVAAIEKKARKPSRGRPKSKTQISVRIDQELMEQAYAYIRQTGLRLTDMIERGLHMVLEAEGQAPLTAVTNPRILISRASEEDGRFVKDLLFWIHYAKYTPRVLSNLEILHRQHLLETLRLVRGGQGYEEVMRGIMGAAAPASYPQIGG